MRTNQFGIDLIKLYEGFKSQIYLDISGNPTIGYGHLMQPKDNFNYISQENADLLLRKDLLVAETAVTNHVKVALNDNQFSALVCWVYNLGEGSFEESTLLQCLNAGKMDDVPGEILRWHRSGKRPVSGLIKRRAAEACLFLS